jgi:uracil-DNA glycosylase
MAYDEELNDIIDDVKKILKQQQELYGGTLIIDDIDASGNKTAANLTDMKNKKEQNLFNNVPSAVKASGGGSGSVSQKYPDEKWVDARDLAGLDSQINKCAKCGLGLTRKKFVFGVGNPRAEVVVVGEAPGADEDEQGEPFVGRAGQLLNKIIEAIQFKREEVFICNILKCRPPNNRDPQSEEIDSCEPYLWKQLELISPKIILCAGRIAGQSLLKTNASLAQLRGKVHDYRGIPLMVTYHPAALLRNPNWKRPCWEDMQQFRKLYDDMKKGTA